MQNETDSNENKRSSQHGSPVVCTSHALGVDK